MLDETELDRLLDSALKTYAEPEHGLEGRVLSSLAEIRVSTRILAPRRRWLYWTAAVPVAACLLFVFTVRKPPQPGDALRQQAHPPEQTATNHFAQNEPPLSTRRMPIPPPRRSTVHALLNADRAVSKPASLPKLDVFPTLQPLSPEEQVLYAFATQVPEEQRQAILDAQKNVDAPLSLAAIRIPPLEVPEAGKN